MASYDFRASPTPSASSSDCGGEIGLFRRIGLTWDQRDWASAGWSRDADGAPRAFLRASEPRTGRVLDRNDTLFYWECDQFFADTLGPLLHTHSKDGEIEAEFECAEALPSDYADSRDAYGANHVYETYAAQMLPPGQTLYDVEFAFSHSGYAEPTVSLDVWTKPGPARPADDRLLRQFCYAMCGFLFRDAIEDADFDSGYASGPAHFACLRVPVA